ncbi:DUF1285 domain-containing protein [Aureimonas jatrophae]|uniref:DUF1285 domain-containing protein n=1 Tax=Aureimonas jatrophae TaxID=1166073 RepID=A0A1H0EMT3_9HYPH|nr:DUF1285 domain-containing protein [Aureimonas jatrophae]MBB3950417.1 hypothetical protein [Aureimonas jatrophae]SDN83714.1 hypothetical protein SAMN05192530_102119 [Aureimonas jatrophae]
MPQEVAPAPAGVSLEALVSRAARAGRDAPPVERWNPPSCGTMDLRIEADGRWIHEGAEIRRPELVALLSSVLRREADGTYALVTPGERLAIAVVDLPFLAVEMSVAGTAAERRLVFRTNAGDVVEAGPEHPLRLEDGPMGFRPRLLVRGGLWARLTRALALDLAELVEERGEGAGLASGGGWFALEPA